MVVIRVGNKTYRVSSRIHGLIMSLIDNRDLITSYDKVKLVHHCRGPLIRPNFEIAPPEVSIRE